MMCYMLSILRITMTNCNAICRPSLTQSYFYVRGLAPDATYQFKHALICDAAYEALLKSRCKELHQLVAQTIDSQFPAIKQNSPEVLAHHWTEAGKLEPAIAAWTAAAKSAERRNAFYEAFCNYKRALSLVALVPKSQEYQKLELDLRLSTVSAVQISKGYSSVEAIEAAREATVIAKTLGSLSQLVTLLLSRCVTVLAAGDLPLAIDLGNQALDLALREDKPGDVARARSLLMIANYHHGDLTGVENHFMAARNLFSDKQWIFPGITVSAFGIASWNAWILGKFASANQRLEQMFNVATNPYDIAFSSEMKAQLCDYKREFALAAETSARALELSKDEFPYIAIISRCSLGRAVALLGRAMEGLELIQQGIAGLRELNSCLGLTYRLTSLAVAQTLAGHTDEAFETVALAQRANPNEIVYQPEKLKLRGELREQRRELALAEADYREAIRLAQLNTARTWELRATTSLAHLLVSTNRREEAYSMLSTVYGWFTEGFETRDLIDAKALLEELGA